MSRKRRTQPRPDSGAPSPALSRDAVFPRHLRLFLLLVLFVSAFGVRAYRINEPLFGFRPVRQYRSALIARSYYYEMLDSLPAWKVRNARITRDHEGVLEPPVMEFLTAVAYRVSGGAFLWIPRLLSSVFWLVGGLFLYLLAARVINRDIAVIVAAVYLCLPYGVASSRAFQPDPMMVMLYVGALYFIVRHFDDPNMRTLLGAAALSAAAMLVKPVCLFFICGAFLPLAVHRNGPRRVLVSRDLWVFLAVSLLPSILYYGYGMVAGGFLRAQAGGSFLPHLLAKRAFWLGWLQNVELVVGYPALGAALVGLVMFRGWHRRALLIGSWGGYIAFGLVFTHHIRSHPYYHLPLIPLVALSLGPVALLILRGLVKLCGRSFARPITAALFLAALTLSVRHALVHRYRIELPRFIEVCREIGELVDHSDKTVFLSAEYGKPLLYHGEIAGVNWPSIAELYAQRRRGRPEVSAADRLARITRNNSSELFIVTRLSDQLQQQELMDLLSEKYPLLAMKDAYLVFDLTRPRRTDGSDGEIIQGKRRAQEGDR